MTEEPKAQEPTEEEKKQALKDVKEQAQYLKKRLKMMSKSQLITLVINYASDLQEMQQVAQMLFEENKELKGESKDEE
jgi:hypothetical protein